MFGAITLPSVSTGFTSDSKSMLPVSIRGMSDKVEMTLGVDSMEDDSYGCKRCYLRYINGYS